MTSDQIDRLTRHLFAAIRRNTNLTHDVLREKVASASAWAVTPTHNIVVEVTANDSEDALSMLIGALVPEHDRPNIVIRGQGLPELTGSDFKARVNNKADGEPYSITPIAIDTEHGIWIVERFSRGYAYPGTTAAVATHRTAALEWINRHGWTQMTLHPRSADETAAEEYFYKQGVVFGAGHECVATRWMPLVIG